MLVRFISIFAVVTTAATAAFAADRTALKQHCTNDYLNFCGDMAPDGPEVQACFKQNKAKLSADCQAAIAGYAKSQKRS